MEDKGVSLPGWKIVGEIGKGSFGTVYEIEKELEFGSKTRSALKVITIPENEAEIKAYRDDGYDDLSITAMFKSRVEDITSEFELMDKLKGNSHVVSFEDHAIVQHDHDPGFDILIRMELLTALPDYIHKRYVNAPIGEDAAIAVGLDICSALELCKRCNIIHRDIKPQNIFVNAFGDYKLGDFGIAKTLDHTTKATKTGTYGYMAPEVYWGKPYNAQADIYSLGMVLYWMLNERRGPFLPMTSAAPKTSQNEEALSRRMNGEPLPAPKHGSNALKRIVLKACAFDPKDRYATPTEMKAELEGILNDAAVQRTGEPELSAQGNEIDYSATVGVFGREPGGSTSQLRDTLYAFKPNTAGKNFNQQPSGIFVAGDEEQANKSENIQDADGGQETAGINNSQTVDRTVPPKQIEDRTKDKKLWMIGAAALVLIAVIVFAGAANQANKTANSSNATSTSVKSVAKPTLAANEAYAAESENAATLTSTPTSTPVPEYIEAISNAKVGSIITFGEYEQDGDISDGKEPIDWLVLDKEDKRILVISRYALDCQRYHSEYTAITWEKCSLRTWLNGTFLNAAFSADERKLIREVTVGATKNKKYPNNEPGNATTDRIFLLSLDEAEKYFSSDSDRRCKATDYSLSMGAYEKDGSCWWWLRSPGNESSWAAGVYVEGGLNYYGGRAGETSNAVRPAMWLTRGN